MKSACRAFWEYGDSRLSGAQHDARMSLEGACGCPLSTPSGARQEVRRGSCYVGSRESRIAKAAAEQIAHLTAEHQTAMGQAQDDIVELEEQHRQVLEEARLETDMLLSEERERQLSVLEEFELLHQIK